MQPVFGAHAAARGLRALAAWALPFAALAASLLAAAPAAAQERKIPLRFTEDLISRIATDSQGERTAEIVDRLIGLSPALLEVRLRRAAGKVTLLLTASAEEDLPVNFQLTLEKTTYYRMRTAGNDVTGMTQALQEAKTAEPLLREIAYRHDGRYAIIDCTLDLGPVIAAAREERERRETAARAVAAAQAAAEAKAAQEARATAALKAAAEARATAQPPPERQPAPTPKAAVPSGPRPEEVSFLAARALGGESAPVIDGQAGDAAWQLAQPFSLAAQGASGRLAVSVRALWSPERIWLLVRWPDRSRDDAHRPWVWSPEKQAYVAGREVEDALSLAFAREGRMGDCMLAGAEAASDLWTWRAGRTNPSGYAEDGTLTLSLQRVERANAYAARNGRTVWIKEEADAGSRPYQAQVAGAFAGDRIPSTIPRTPSGSMGDVEARGSWSDGHWTVELSRRLSTGDPADAVLEPGREAFLSVAVYNSREGGDHSTSKEIALRLE